MDSITDILINNLVISFGKSGLDLTDWIPEIIATNTNADVDVDFTLKNLGKLFKHNDKTIVMKSLEAVCEHLNNMSNGFYVASYVKLFVNFKLTKLFLYKQIGNILKTSQITKQVTQDKKKRIIVDYSSPNIAKNMHVGHLRSTIIGDVISNIFEKQGHTVSRVNHVGDFGLQFGMIIEYLLRNNIVSYDQIAGADLQEIYTTAKKIFTTDESFKTNSYANTVVLQNEQDNSTHQIYCLWKIVCEVSMNQYDKIYDKLNIHLDVCAESFYKNMLLPTVDELKAKKIGEYEDGRYVIKTKFGPMTAVKSDGGFTYDTTDLAALRYRLTILDVDEVYYVVDSGQSGHFEQLFEIAKQAGWLCENDKNKHVEHVNFGVVLGEDGKRIRSRDGDTPKLDDLLIDAYNETVKIIEERNGSDEFNIASDLAHGSVKYADISTSRTNDYIFSFKRMLSFNGNTLCYIMYARTRLNSILNNAFNYDEICSHVCDMNNANDLEKSDYDVISLIMEYDSIVAKSAMCYPHHICKFMQKLADAIHSMYTNSRCFEFGPDKEIISMNRSRIALFIAIKKLMDECFSILNIKPLDKL